MKLTFLGTGTSQGVPVIACHCGVCSSTDSRDRRLRTSALLQVAVSGQQVAGSIQEQVLPTTHYPLTANILIDIGPDFRQQMLRHHVDRLDAILITHAHRDHVGGLDDIRSFNYVQHKKMDVFLNAEAAHAIQRDYHYIFEPHQYPGLPEAELHVVGEEVFSIQCPVASDQCSVNSDQCSVSSDATQSGGSHWPLATGIDVTPIHAMHKDLPVLGFRIGDMAYITDANYLAPAEMEKLKGLKVLVLNALRQKTHFSHYCLSEALEVIAQLKPERAFLTHISHEMGLHEEVNRMLPAGVQLAYDDEEVEI